MTTRIIPVQLGITHCYLIQDRGLILVDCGPRNQVQSFLKQLDQMGYHPSDIKLILLTHGHFDHIGSATEIKAISGAPLAMHVGDAEPVEQGVAIPVQGISSWGRVVAAFSGLAAGLSAINPLSIDIKLGDDAVSLEPYGIPGRILHTPGHTRGSVSVLLEDGQAFVGDLAMNMAPLRFSPGLSIFGYDAGAVKASCARLLGLGAKVIYPSHGMPFSAEVLRRVL